MPRAMSQFGLMSEKHPARHFAERRLDRDHWYFLLRGRGFFVAMR
jgi:hypothetical protein